MGILWPTTGPAGCCQLVTPSWSQVPRVSYGVGARFITAQILVTPTPLVAINHFVARTGAPCQEVYGDGYIVPDRRPAIEALGYRMGPGHGRDSNVRGRERIMPDLRRRFVYWRVICCRGLDVFRTRQ